MTERHSRLLAGLAVVLLLLGVWATPALAVLPLPSGFYGAVLDLSTGGPVPNGTAIVAKVGNLVVGQTSTFAFDGSQVYTLDVQGDDPDTPLKDGASAGDEITFAIFGVAVPQTGIWVGGTSVRLDLVRPPVALPPPPAGQAPAPGPTPVPRPTATPIPLPTVISEAQITPVPKKEGETSTIVQPIQQLRVQLEDKTLITVPPLAMPITTQIKARSVPPKDLPKPPKGRVRKAVEIELFDDKGGKIESIEIRRPIIIEVPLTKEDLADMGDDPNNIELRRFDEGSQTWVKLNAEVDLVNSVIRGRLTHLSLFAVVVPVPVGQAAPTPVPTPMPTQMPTPNPTPTAALPTGGELPGSQVWLLALGSGLLALAVGFRLLKRAIDTVTIE